MVDPNPGRGMPLQLQKYWLAGKGAAKIRWNIPGDFKRCVRNLRKWFPKNPEGLCNILHTKATGGPPGHGSAEKPLHALHASMVGHYNLEALTAAQALMDKQPELGRYTWAAPLAPIGRPTSEPRRSRVFEPGSLYHRTLPLPLDFRERQAPGHTGAVTVGRILGLTYGPDHQGSEYAWGWGDFLDESIIPDATKARYLAEQGVYGTSLDPGGPITAGVDPESGQEHMIKFGIGGATMVPIEAFTLMRMHVFDGEDGDWPEDDPDMQALLDGEDCGCGEPKAVTAGNHWSDWPDARPSSNWEPPKAAVDAAFAVNSSGWRGLPLAPREAVFDNDDAVKRITAWAGGDAAKMQKAFMWHSDQGNPLDPTSYRLPLGDIINGELTIIFHAIYAAAALMSGAHGGLPDVSPHDDAEIRSTISQIYAEMATAFGDTSVRAPWDRSAQEGVQLSMDQFAAAEPYGDVKYADPGYRDGKKRYPIDTEEHCRAAWSYINQADNAKLYNANQLKQIKSRIMAAGKKYGINFSDAEGGGEDSKEIRGKDMGEYSASGIPITPPKAWFQDPKLPRKTKLTVTPEGRVYGHLAAWNECHRDVAMRECVLAPKSMLDYAPFHLGSTLTAEGELIDTGKIVMDTRHANINLGYAATAIHYDNTGDEIASIRCGEDEFGIWFAGSVVPEATPSKIAKLRRSPLSGDWRRERGSLELTAALAVNAPAFPVYAMEDDQRLALVAAGSVWYDDGDYILASDVPTGIVNAITTAVQDAFAAQEDRETAEQREERLRDLLEDDEIYARRARQERLMKVFTADQTGVLQR
jgi:hypothetical protein